MISVHHFVSQDIHTCEDPVAATTAAPDYLLLALPQHVVEVRDLSRGGDVVFSFPTVDQAHQMLHCCHGNYVVTLEAKHGHQGKEFSYARIYANWDTTNAVQQAMRARIAGRVTPSSTQSGPPSLEMIELPLKRNPSIIACCQVTGNLLVASQKTLMLYLFQVCTHDISRLRFIDFEESGVYVELSLCPSSLSLAENIVMCMAEEFVHVFRLGPRAQGGAQCQESGEQQHRHAIKSTSTDSYIDWDEIMSGEVNADSKLHENSFPLRVDLPSIVSSSCGAVQRRTPFQVAPQTVTAVVHCASPAATSWAAECEVVHLLQLHMSTLQASSSSNQVHSSVHDEFRCQILKPLYVKTDSKQPCDRTGTAVNPLQSKHHADMASVVCLVATQQEGYLYYFNVHNLQEPSWLQQASCVTVYPFTAPVTAVAMESYVLHALTESGLETYTLRTSYQFASTVDLVNNVTSACPPIDDPVCLVGLRPFLGVERLLISDSHLVLLACCEGSSSSSQDSHYSGGWTLYSLSLPSPCVLYTDILCVASAHQWSSPTTYHHLLCEGHIVLRTALTTAAWMPGSSEALPRFYDDEFTNTLDELYRDSCALLADYYIMCDNEEDWNLAPPYYKMAGLTPIEVVNRVKTIEVPSEMAVKRKHQGLTSYLHKCLLHMNQAPGDMFSPALPSFAHTVLDLFEQYNPVQVSALVLCSSLLREYATDRVLAIMKKQLSTRAVPAAADALALVLLCIQRGSPEQAVAVLDSLSPTSLANILSDNPSLLLEEQCSSVAHTGPSSCASQKSSASSIPCNTLLSNARQSVLSFSELSSVLMDSKPAVLADVLANLVTVSKFATLQGILQVFLEYIPSRIGVAGSAASSVLQKLLEQYFAWYFSDMREENLSSYDVTTVEALKILVRSYLSDLQWHSLSVPRKKRQQNIESQELKTKITSDITGSSWEDHTHTKVLFEEKRSAFLDKMPPYSGDLSKRLISLQEGTGSASHNVAAVQPGENAATDTLFKLQCLLCSGKLPQECVVEVHQFVQTHPQLQGNLSLQVLCVPIEEAATILLDFCPHALLQYTKDRFSREAEWRSLLLMLHRKVQALGEKTVLKPLYLQVTNDILTYLSQTLSLEEICRVLPPGGENMYGNYVQICQQVGHANHIRALLMATGQQLLATLNL